MVIFRTDLKTLICQDFFVCFQREAVEEFCTAVSLACNDEESLSPLPEIMGMKDVHIWETVYMLRSQFW